MQTRPSARESRGISLRRSLPLGSKPPFLSSPQGSHPSPALELGSRLPPSHRHNFSASACVPFAPESAVNNDLAAIPRRRFSPAGGARDLPRQGRLLRDGCLWWCGQESGCSETVTSAISALGWAGNPARPEQAGRRRGSSVSAALASGATGRLPTGAIAPVPRRPCALGPRFCTFLC